MQSGKSFRYLVRILSIRDQSTFSRAYTSSASLLGESDKMKRSASRNGSISPPPLKRKIESTTTSASRFESFAMY